MGLGRSCRLFPYGSLAQQQLRSLLFLGQNKENEAVWVVAEKFTVWTFLGPCRYDTLINWDYASDRYRLIGPIAIVPATGDEKVLFLGRDEEGRAVWAAAEKVPASPEC